VKGLEQAGKVVLGAVDKAVELRWDQAMQVAASTQGSADERIRQIKRAFAREMSAVGAAAGATAALPGAGAVALVGTTVVELGWFTARSADLILSVAAVHGQTESTVEQRRAWILSVLAFGDGASAGFTKLAGEMGKGLGKRTTAAIPNEALKAINKALGRTIVTKYGTKRGVIALGRALPFGIGAVIGGTTNYAFARTIARQADEFFRLLPPPLMATTAPASQSSSPALRSQS
jgi:hypothetical protein